MVVLKIDGREFSRAIVPRASHADRTIDRFFTASVDAAGSQVIHGNRFKIRQVVGNSNPADYS